MNPGSDDGVTYLLFLGMAKETATESQLPKGYRWDDLAKNDGVELLDEYRKLLLHLGSHGSGRVQQIYGSASTTIRQPRNLQTLGFAVAQPANDERGVFPDRKLEPVARTAYGAFALRCVALR